MHKVLWRFDLIPRVIKLASFAFNVSNVILVNAQNISPLVFFAFFLSFMEKKSPIRFYGVFDQFLRIYEVSKL